MHSASSFLLDLPFLFQKVNGTYFDGFLDFPQLAWNSRLRSCSGRFIPGSRRFWKEAPPRIEIASYLKEEMQAEALVLDTLSHEMIHYWLWVLNRPYGHTSEFYAKMTMMGVSRYNTVAKFKSYQYLYHCKFCQKSFQARKKLDSLACLKCCKEFSCGNYDIRFKLVLSEKRFQLPKES